MESEADEYAAEALSLSASLYMLPRRLNIARSSHLVKSLL